MSCIIYEPVKTIVKFHVKCAMTSLLEFYGRPWHPSEPGVFGTGMAIDKSRKTDLQKMSYYKKHWPTFFTATFIRNPFDRMVSAYYYSYQHFSRSHPDRVSEYTFDAFIDDIRQDTRKYFGKPVPYVHFIDIPVDFIGKFENLEEDVKTLCELRNVKYPGRPKQRNRSRRPSKGYREFFTDKTREIVYNLYEDDFKRFNYSW